MSKMKDFLIEFCKGEYIDVNSLDTQKVREYIKRRDFINLVDEKLSGSSKYYNGKLKFFYESIIYKTESPKKPYRLSVYGKDENEKYLKWCSFQELLNFSSVLKDFAGFNLYYLPLPFKRKSAKEKNAGYTKSFYIDIDGIPLSLTGESHEERRCEIVELLLNDYNVPYESLPPFVVCSGHGLHLYFTIPDEKADEKHKEKVRRVCAYFNGDFSGVSPAHIIRVPTSYNAKSVPVRSELFVLKKPEYSWEYIEPLFASEEETERVYKAYNDAKNEKRRRTLEAKKSTITSAGDIKRTKNQNKKKTLKDNSSKMGSADDIVELINSAEVLDMSITEDIVPKINNSSNPLRESAYINFNYKDMALINNSMFSKRATDLLNYYHRRNGKIDGCRNVFFTIYVYTLKAWGTTENETMEKCLQLIEPDFKTELVQIIEKAYRNRTTYKYKNETIAELLNFQEFDYEHSYSIYRKKDRLERERLRAKKNYEQKRKHNSDKKEHIRNTIANNPQKTNKELANMLGVCVNTITKYRKTI